MLDDVKNGLTSTIMIGESAGRPALYRKGKPVGNVPQHIVNGGGWMRPASDFSIDGSSYDGTTLPGPCPINCTNGDDEGGPATEPYPYYVTQGTGEAYSFHPGGANFVFGDGSRAFHQRGYQHPQFCPAVNRSRCFTASSAIIRSLRTLWANRERPQTSPPTGEVAGGAT